MTAATRPPTVVEPGAPVRGLPRLPGPDVVRAVALIGVVVMNYHGYLLLRRTPGRTDVAGRFFDPWNGPLSTRFAATFVLVAGVGVTLLTRSSTADQPAMAAMRWRLARRGVVLYVAGLLLDTIWPGTILPYYGALFTVAALVVTWRSRWVLAAGAVAALAGAAIAWWRFERRLDGVATTWFDGEGGSSPRTMLLDVFVNGTHPLLPWLVFFCSGIVLGRMLDRPLCRPVCAAGGLTVFAIATIVSDGVTAADTGSGLASLLASDDPFQRGLLYVASALGTALVAFAVISWIADRYAAMSCVRLLVVAGQMSLSLYVAHALVFNLVVDWLGWVRPAGLDTALLFALGYWIVGIGAAWLWSRRYRRGPLEIVYRRLTA